jgi:ABC-type dipeptide/oligopeptide/nickel transport system permease component
MPIFWWGMMLIMLVSVQLEPDAGFRARQRYGVP